MLPVSRLWLIRVLDMVQYSTIEHGSSTREIMPCPLLHSLMCRRHFYCRNCEGLPRLAADFGEVGDKGALIIRA